MYLEEPTGNAGNVADKVADKVAVPLRSIGKETLIPALVCAGVCVFLMRAGFFTFFFLVPMGICAAVFGPAAAWLGAVCAMLGNGVWAAGLSLYSGTGLEGAGLDILYFSVLVLGFTWIMAGNPALSSIPPVRTVFRFIAVSVVGALLFLGMGFLLGRDADFSAVLHSRIGAIISSYIASSGIDAAQQAFLERQLTPEWIIEVFTMIILRGGALVPAFFLLFFSRQTAFVFARLFRRFRQQQGRSDLMGFHVPRRAIWVLSLCLPVILLCRAISLEIIEIAAWNVLVICAIMFLAQGGGIVLFNLARRPMSMIMRLLCSVLFVLVIFSPGINVLALGLLVLLGIAENWLPLRVTKQEMPDL